MPVIVAVIITIVIRVIMRSTITSAISIRLVIIGAVENRIAFAMIICVYSFLSVLLVGFCVDYVGAEWGVCFVLMS